MECRNAQILLAFAPPASGELDADDAAALQDHLDICADCQAISQAERRFDEAVGRAINAVEIPDGLKMRLTANLDGKRDAWYRRAGYRAAAAAAAILLLVVGGFLWVRSRRVDVDLFAVREAEEQSLGPDIGAVKAWLDRTGYGHLPPPPQYRYELLTWYGFADLQGRRVPALYFVTDFRTRGRIAKVLIVDANVFDLPAMVKQYNDNKPTLESGGLLNLTLDEHPSDAHVRYLVLHQGSLASFKKKQNNPPAS